MQRSSSDAEVEEEAEGEDDVTDVAPSELEVEAGDVEPLEYGFAVFLVLLVVVALVELRLRR